MKAIIIIISILGFTSCSSKRVVNTTNETKDSLAVLIDSKQDSMLTTVPVCIRQLIKKFEAEEKQNPPRSVFSYVYNEKVVYYVPPICCDFFSDLYDDKCNLIAHPDGGFTGRGDGKITDFKEKRTDGKLIWNDDRK